MHTVETSTYPRLQNYRLTTALVLFMALPICAVSSAHAQVTATVDATVAPCDEFATKELGNPWDMSDSADVNFFTPNDINSISNLSIGTGLFSGVTTLTAGGHFYLLSPQVASTQPIGGRWGQNHPIDVAKYRFLTVRMSLSDFDPGGGMRVLFNRAKNYSDARTFTSPLPTRPGWSSVATDLAATTIDPSSANTQPWSAGSITGFALYPTIVNQSFEVDYIRLEDPATCGSATASVAGSASGSNTHMSVYLDTNDTPFDGYFKKLLSSEIPSTRTVTLSALGLAPGAYKVTSIIHGDYATLEADDPWDMNSSYDVSLLGGVGGGTFASGAFSGTTTSGSPTIFLRIPSGGSIPTAKYSKLSIKVTKSTRDVMNVFWTGGGVNLFPAVNDPDGDNVWTVDLSTVPSWTGNVSDLIIQPSLTTGTSFSLDFVSLRTSGFVTNDTPPTATVSSGNFTVAAPPIARVIQPDVRGGEAVKPWNFLPDDLDFSLNVRSDADPANPGEAFTTYLPDVRLVGGRRGDFFKGTNIAGNDDPNDFLSFPFTPENQFTFDGSVYRNMCLTMMVDREYDLALGSVSKLFYGKVGQSTEEFDAWVTIYDRWSGNRWYEYCSDLATHPREDGQVTWGGEIDLFRIDPHEFHLDSCCDMRGNPIGNPIFATYYYDSLKLRRDDTSNGRFALVYSVTDPDTISPATTFAYNTSKSLSGATPIPPSSLTCEGFVCVWDTRSVPVGRYFVLATSSDGLGNTTATSSGALRIDNDPNAPALTPRLEVESPTNGQNICSSLQLKGYALVENRNEDISAVQVFVDGQFFALLNSNQYSPRARAAFPNSDSSNTGFDQIHSAASIPAGARQIRVVAHASDGSRISQDINITRVVGCVDPVPVSDGPPAGAPAPARVSTGGGTTPTPRPGSTPTPAPGAALGLRATHSSSGTLSLVASGIPGTAARCTATVRGGASGSSLSPLRTVQFTPARLRNRALQIRASRLRVDRAQVPSLFFTLETSCGGRSAASLPVQVFMQTRTGLTTADAVLRALSRSLRVSTRR